MAQNTNGNGPNRISVSHELLRAELNELKLWMLGTFAAQDEVKDNSRRIRKLEDESVTREALARTTEASQKKTSRKQTTLTGAVVAILALFQGLREAGIF